METTTTSYFWFVISACVGGVFVVIGLLLETLADKKWFKTFESRRKWERWKHIGEWVVIGGVLIEVVVAGWTAKDEWQTRQLAKQNDWHKSPIVSSSAKVVLKFTTTNAVDHIYRNIGHVKLEPNIVLTFYWRYAVQMQCVKADVNPDGAGVVVTLSFEQDQLRSPEAYTWNHTPEDMRAITWNELTPDKFEQCSNAVVRMNGLWGDFPVSGLCAVTLNFNTSETFETTKNPYSSEGHIEFQKINVR